MKAILSVDTTISVIFMDQVTCTRVARLRSTYTYGCSDPGLVSQPSSADPGTSGTDKEGSPEVEVPGVITQV